jgi:hypothetical protein
MHQDKQHHHKPVFNLFNYSMHNEILAYSKQAQQLGTRKHDKLISINATDLAECQLIPHQRAALIFNAGWICELYLSLAVLQDIDLKKIKETLAILDQDDNWPHDEISFLLALQSFSVHRDWAEGIFISSLSHKLSEVIDTEALLDVFRYDRRCSFASVDYADAVTLLCEYLNTTCNSMSCMSTDNSIDQIKYMCNKKDAVYIDFVYTNSVNQDLLLHKPNLPCTLYVRTTKNNALHYNAEIIECSSSLIHIIDGTI